MKRVHIFFFLIFNLSFSQDCDLYFEYNSLVKKSHELYNSKKVEQASKVLLKAITLEKIIPYGKDLDFATRVALKSGNTELAESACVTLAKGGVPLSYFSRFKKFKWFKKFQSNFETYNSEFVKKSNVDLKNATLKLIDKDNSFNMKYHGWRAGKTNLSIDEMIKLATDIYIEFEDLVSKYGFPNEEKMGYFYDYRKKTITEYKLGVLLIHIYQRGELIHYNELQSLVCNGSLDPNLKKILDEINTQFEGVSVGVEKEMLRRYNEYSKKK